ncbi:MAG: type I-E CRISPR-associated protein Cas6/Cse3/CasE [Gammaproteobacteria bacterium]|jgi:CRISPR system Cascade subunit CasE|nr:type I-E CRISPR-associated protein Cas6/Cse3/CasE [Gammaproteobacteria bacterium]
MYMSRVTLKKASWDGALSRVATGYGVHQALWRLFDEDPNARRDFLYRQETEQNLPRFLIVSQRVPADREGLWHVETKEYHPRLAAGQLLSYSLRVNPVVTRQDEAGRSHRHDVVMDFKRHHPEGSNRLSQAERVQQSVWQWLEARAGKAGFSAKQRDFRAEGYRQHELRKKGGQRIRFSTVDCAGLLTVTDPDVLTRSLFNGIGPAKGFGCGLLLVRRL